MTPVDAVEVDRIVLSGIDTLLADADSLRGQLLAGRRAERERLGHIAQEAREGAVAAERAAERAEARYADALAADDEDVCEVLLAAASRKRREAREATERANAALDALSSAQEEPESAQAADVLGRVWRALSGRVSDADGDIRKLNAALREWFGRFETPPAARQLAARRAGAQRRRDRAGAPRPQPLPALRRAPARRRWRCVRGAPAARDDKCAGTPLDLAEDECSPVRRDEVELAITGAEVARDDRVAATREVLFGDSLAQVSVVPAQVDCHAGEATPLRVTCG